MSTAAELEKATADSKTYALGYFVAFEVPPLLEPALAEPPPLSHSLLSSPALVSTVQPRPVCPPAPMRGIASQLSARPASLAAPEGSLALDAKQTGVLRSGRTVAAAFAGTRDAGALVPLPC